METNFVLSNFASGEISPNTWARSDRPFYKSGLEVCVNNIPDVTGPMMFRPAFVMSCWTRYNLPAVLLPFTFNDSQAYSLEFTEYKMRILSGDGVLLEAAKAITGITAADPAVVTSASHGYANGDEVYIAGVVGMTEVNGQFYRAANVAANTFELQDVYGNDVDSSAFTAYASGGEASRVYTINTPYTYAEAKELKLAQAADIMYLTHPSHMPRKLIRAGALSWSIATFPRTNDFFLQKSITAITKANPGQVTTSENHGLATGDVVILEDVGGMIEVNNMAFTVTVVDATHFTLGVNTTAYTTYTSGGVMHVSGDAPAACGFYGGRLWYGGSANDPDQFWGSRGPNATTGAQQYDYFTVGTAANDAITFRISSQTNTVEQIRWFAGTPKFLAIGSYGGVFKANGGSDGAAITPTAISVTPVEGIGCKNIMPLLTGTQIGYVERGGRKFRSFEYSFYKDSYESFDKTLLANEVSKSSEASTSGFGQLAFTSGSPDLVWSVRTDGVLLSTAILSVEDVAAWSRHKIGGEGKVLSACGVPRENNVDRLWITVERAVNGVTIRTNEYLSDDPMIPDFMDFFTGEDKYQTDLTVFQKLLFERQREFIRLDSALVYDGTQSETLNLTGVTEGTIQTATAGGNVFTTGMVGRRITVKFIDGSEDGWAVITAINSATEAEVRILKSFDDTDYAANTWMISTDTIGGLYHKKGGTVSVITDGGIHRDVTVRADGRISLDYQTFYCIMGDSYKGILRIPELDFGAPYFTAIGRDKNINRIVLMFRNTQGVKYSADRRGLYALEEIAYREEGYSYYDRPAELFTGPKELEDLSGSDIRKNITIVQEKLPCTLMAIVVFMDVNTES